jgi:hypothetical protein
MTITNNDATTAAHHCHYSHYIFGYGSLLCPISRAITIPTLKHRIATPVKVKHLQRMWSFPVVDCRMTFMGIMKQPQQPQQQHHQDDAAQLGSDDDDDDDDDDGCAGVLVPILNDAELELLDAREYGYERQRIEHDHVIAIPHLQHHGTYFTSVQQTTKSNEESSQSNSSQSPPCSLPNVWVYVQTAPAPIQEQCPIAQSYLDIILRGALSVSPDFARDVILSTRGWHAHDIKGLLSLPSHEKKSEEEAKEPKEASTVEATTTSTTTTTLSPPTVFWVNDRHDPIYVRADVEYSQTHGHEIDALLEQHCPAEYSYRRPHYGNQKKRV